MAAGLCGCKGSVGREGDPEGLVDPGEARDGVGEHDGEVLVMECGKDLLGLAEGVAKEDGDLVVGDGLMAEADDAIEDVACWRKEVVGPAEGGFHDEDVGMAWGAGLGREAGAELEVAGVKDGGVADMEERHGRAEDMAGGQEGEGGVARGSEGGVEEVGGGVEWEDVFSSLAMHAGMHEATGGLGEDDLRMGGDMVGVGMGNDRDVAMGHWAARVHPQSEGWKVQPAMLQEKVGRAHA